MGKTSCWVDEAQYRWVGVWQFRSGWLWESDKGWQWKLDFGFTKRIGIMNSFIAEMWGLREGLIMCCNLNIASLIFELDARAVVDAFNNTQYVNNVIPPLLDDCRLLSSRFSLIQFKHCYR